MTCFHPRPSLPVAGAVAPALLALALVALALSASAGRAASTEASSVAVGPWKVEADFRGAKFTGCAMSRTTPDDVEVRISRDDQGMVLRMTSPKWRLGRGKSYPVDLVAGNLDEKADVSASGDAVSVRLTDDEFIGKLAAENELDVKGAGSTIRVALDGSAAALDRLNGCFKKNSAASTEANPFVAPKDAPKGKP